MSPLRQPLVELDLLTADLRDRTAAWVRQLRQVEASVYSRPESHPGMSSRPAPLGVAGLAAGVGPPAPAASHTTPGCGWTRGVDAGVDAVTGVGLRPPAWAEVAGCRGLATSAPNHVGDRHT